MVDAAHLIHAAGDRRDEPAAVASEDVRGRVVVVAARIRRRTAVDRKRIGLDGCTGRRDAQSGGGDGGREDRRRGKEPPGAQTATADRPHSNAARTVPALPCLQAIHESPDGSACDPRTGGSPAGTVGSRSRFSSEPGKSNTNNKSEKGEGKKA